MLKRYSDYFDTYSDIKITNICGSCGKKAVPLAVLGAEVTVFDISEDNKRYALEVAAAAKVNLNFEICDILEIDTGRVYDCGEQTAAFHLNTKPAAPPSSPHTGCYRFPEALHKN